MASYTHLIIFSLTFILSSTLLLSPLSNAVDPSPLQDFCVADLNSALFINGYPCKNPSEVTSDDFFYQGFQQPPTGYDSLDINITQVNVGAFPGLNTLGVSMNRVTLKPGGLNPPHIHPRSSELSLVLRGKLYVGWISTNYVLYSKVVSAGELFVIPPGVVHFQLNICKGNARFYASFNSQNPGVQQVGRALFSSTPEVPDEVLSKALHTNDSIIQIIKTNFSAIPGLSSLSLALSA